METLLVRKHLQDRILRTDELSPLQHEERMPDTLIRHVLSVSPPLLHIIFSMKHPGLKYLITSRCLPNHIAEQKSVLIRGEDASTVVPMNQCSIQERSHVVTLVLLECIARKLRKRNSIFPHFIHSFRRYSRSVLRSPTSL